jgi:hypothetical protein
MSKYTKKISTRINRKSAYHGRLSDGSGRITHEQHTSHYIFSLTIFIGVSAMALFVSPMNSSSSAASSFSAACIDRFFRWKLPGEEK